MQVQTLMSDCLVISRHLRSKGAGCKNPLISVVNRGTWRILPASPPFIQTPSKMSDSYSDGLVLQVLMPPVLHWPSQHLMYNMLTGNVTVPTSSRGWTQRMFLS
ncbi:unnamed protein product [Sphagnum jensenii]|uniref:Uncharacterized protein n=1 Tax=Sphagnum jensenii TaxID=128206 RepID=A0ABP1B5E1_9BRYO